MKSERIFKKLFDNAVENPGMAGAKLASCIIKKNEVLSFGQNQDKTDPLQAKFGINKNNRRVGRATEANEAIFLHAEIDALKKAMRQHSVDAVEGSTLYIARVKKRINTDSNFVFGNSKPCAGCMNALRAFKVAKVVYTHDELGTVGELTFEY